MSPQDSDQLFDGFILHRADYSDTSLLVEIFSRPHGRFPAIAKGAKRRNNPSSALLQPFQSLLLSVSGRGEVRSITKVEPAAAASALMGRALYCGFYLNELIMRLLARNDPHTRLFDEYSETLLNLSGPRSHAEVLRHFEVGLLRETGYALILDHEVQGGQPLQPDARYRYDPERGPLPCGEQEHGFHVAGRTLDALRRGLAMDPDTQREAKALMRRILAFHLGERPLKSRELFAKLVKKDRQQYAK